MRSRRVAGPAISGVRCYLLPALGVGVGVPRTATTAGGGTPGGAVGTLRCGLAGGGAAAPAEAAAALDAVAPLLRPLDDLGLLHQLDHDHRGGVAGARAELEDAGVAAGPVEEARRDLGEQLVD